MARVAEVGLAWATSDEGSRVQIDLAGIEAALRETRLDLPPGEAFQIVERLADEEVVERDGPTYRYAVPLYRRWVSWRWPPERGVERQRPRGTASGGSAIRRASMNAGVGVGCVDCGGTG